jgi:hypothetical protein
MKKIISDLIQAIVLQAGGHGVTTIIGILEH